MPLENRDEHGNSEEFLIPSDILNTFDHPGSFENAEANTTAQRWYTHELFSKHLNVKLLQKFSKFVYAGAFELIKQITDQGCAPPLDSFETPLKLGYASLVVIGARSLKTRSDLEVSESNPFGMGRHVDLLKFLLSKGAPVDLKDIAGRTALNHAITYPGRIQRMDIIRVLLEQGADVNHQDGFGGVVLIEALNQNHPPSVDVLMEFGAALDIVDFTTTLTPRNMLKACGPQVITVVQRWLRRRAGVEDPPLSDKWCDNCRTEGLKLSKCANCKTTRYCGKACQRAHWPEHKSKCRSFWQSLTVTVRPDYDVPPILLHSMADLLREFTRGEPIDRTLTRRVEEAVRNPGAKLHGSKSMIVKVTAISKDPSDMERTSEFVAYTKKRDFACRIHRGDNPSAFQHLLGVVKTKGIGGDIAYFAAELTHPEYLTMKIDDVLAEQPF